MLDGIKSFFQSAMSPPESADAGVRDRDIRLAACALLLELAYADDHFSDAERGHLRSAVRRQFGLDHAQADRLLDLAEQERREAVDLWQFTSLIRESYSPGQKMVLVEIMWGLVYSDGELASKEDYLLRKMCNLLHLEPAYLSEMRRRVRAGEAEGGAGAPGID